MKRKLILMPIAAGILFLLAAGPMSAQEEGYVWFGLGGSSGGLFLPELDAINIHLVDEGFGVLPDIAWSAGGRGRGGMLHGLSIGGIGWAAGSSSQGENRSADYGVGFAGIELGYVAGGDERSLLTLGIVFGGGGSVLTLWHGVEGGSGCSSQSPKGIVVGPVTISAASAFIAIEPFVSFQVQPVPFIGFELHLGYLLPVVGYEWGDIALAEASLLPRGPVIGATLTWGAIGRLRTGGLVGEETVVRTAELEGPCVVVEGTMGEIVVEAWPGDETGIEVTATKRTLWEADLEQVEIRVEPTRCGLVVRADGPAMSPWGVDYHLRIPGTTELDVRHGIGSVQLSGLSGQAIVELGVGQIVVDAFGGPSLEVDAGVGHVALSGVAGGRAEIALGTGNIDVEFPPDASYELRAGVGIGGLSFDTFPGFEAAGFTGPGGHAEATIGAGEHEFSIDLGIGNVSISTTAGP